MECRGQVWGVGVRGSGFRVQGSGFRVQGSGFRVQGSGSRVQGPGSRGQGLGLGVGVALMSAHAGIVAPPLRVTCRLTPPFKNNYFAEM